MISDTARFGGLSRGRMLIDDSFRDKLDLIINDIKSGKFNDELSNHVENSELYESFSNIEKETKKIIKLINKK